MQNTFYNGKKSECLYCTIFGTTQIFAIKKDLEIPNLSLFKSLYLMRSANNLNSLPFKDICRFTNNGALLPCFIFRTFANM